MDKILHLEKILVFDIIKNMEIKLSEAEYEAIRPLPTQNSLAFIAFCKGIDYEDRNLIGQARFYYKKALELHSTFQMAKQKLTQLSVKRLSILKIVKLVALEIFKSKPTQSNEVLLMYSKSQILIYSFVLFNFLHFLSCATVHYQKDISEYQSEISKLEAKLKVNPEDSEALRDLGVIYFETGQYLLAKDYLQKSYVQNPEDPKTMFYLGMTLEFRYENREALQIHAQFIEVSRLSPYRKLMEGRYRKLNREIIREEIHTLLQQEQQLGEDRMTPKTIAVFPLSYQGKDRQFAALGKGLSEMIIIDLGQVRELKLLERIRLQTLLQEMELAQTAVIDKRTAPRIGKLLGSAKLITGTFNVLKKKQLQVDVLSWDILNRQFPAAASKSDALGNLFKLEKELVFNVIEEMGIELTPEERDNIQRIPTKNMQAFLAFCNGLEKEDAGRFEVAAKFYQQAMKLDPNFKKAEIKAETAESLNQAGGSREDVLVQIAKIEGKESLPSYIKEELINNRLQNLGNNVGSNFVPGQDSRKSTEEASNSGADLGELPEPPEPPE